MSVSILDLWRNASKIIDTYPPNVKYIKCQGCGKFISYKAISENKAKYHFIPDSICGPEESYWECEKCK